MSERDGGRVLDLIDELRAFVARLAPRQGVLVYIAQSPTLVATAGTQ